MCLMAFAWGMHPDCVLLLAANRDEIAAYAANRKATAPWRPTSTKIVWIVECSRC